MTRQKLVKLQCFKIVERKGEPSKLRSMKLTLQKLVKLRCTQIVETNERERPKWHCKNSWNGKVCVIWQNQVKMWRKNRKLALVKAEVIISRLLRWFLYFLTIHWPRSSSGTKNSDVNLLASCNRCWVSFFCFILKSWKANDFIFLFLNFGAFVKYVKETKTSKIIAFDIL